jgi:hypothetical protein
VAPEQRKLATILAAHFVGYYPETWKIRIRRRTGRRGDEGAHHHNDKAVVTMKLMSIDREGPPL